MTREELISKCGYMFSLAQSTDEIYPISFGFECGNGWYELIERCTLDIAILDTEKIVRVLQVKEKFGTLRYYVSFDSEKELDRSYYDNIYERISEAEKESSITCEVCGKSGKLNTSSGWLTTLCEECNDKRN